MPNGDAPNTSSGDSKSAEAPKTGDTSSDSGAQFDAAQLTQDQINQILEKNELIWKSDRIAGLRDKARQYDQLAQEKEEADKKALETQGKFKELSEKQAQELEQLRSQLKESGVNQHLSEKLMQSGVIDLEAALKLISRDGIEITDDGTVNGADKAIENLKETRQYLFGKQSQSSVGSPTNQSNADNGPPRFKASQLRGPEGAKFYQENREEIIKAQKAGLIERD